MPDFGKLKDNVYKGTKAMLPHTVTVSCKMHSFDKNGNQPDFDYPRLMKMIKQSAYKGILAIEWEGSALEPVAGVKASKKLIEQSLS
jgi:L-ribulose-5-phosphate 3-epimerase UlaE